MPIYFFWILKSKEEGRKKDNFIEKDVKKRKNP